MKSFNFVLIIIVIFLFFTKSGLSQIPKFPKPPIFPGQKKPKEPEKPLSILHVLDSIKGINKGNQEVLIPSSSYLLPSNLIVKKTTFNEGTNELLFLIVKQGKVASSMPVYLIDFDQVNDTVVWSYETVFGKGIKLFNTSDLSVLQCKKGDVWNNYAISNKSGQLIWQNNYELRSPIPEKKIALSGSFDCIDLSTGQIRWARQVDNTFGLIEDFFIGDKLFSLADGLHCIDPENGKGWSVYAPMGKSERADAASDILGGMMFGLLPTIITSFNSNYYIGNLSGHEGNANEYISPELLANNEDAYPSIHAINRSGKYIRTGLGSNIFFQKGKIYFSANNTIICVDSISGKKIWTKMLPDQRTGAGIVTGWDDMVLFINKGLCFRDKTFRYYFIPYFTFLNSETGDIICSRGLLKRYDPVIDIQTSDSSMFLLLEKDLISYNRQCSITGKLSDSQDSSIILTSGNFIQFLSKDQLGDIYSNSFTDKNHYESLLSMVSNDYTFFLLAEKGIVCFDKKMHKTGWIPEDDLHHILSRNNRKSLLGPLNEYLTKRIVIDEGNQGEVILRLDPFCRSEVEKDLLILYRADNTVSTINWVEACKHSEIME
ncbi:MAG: PQQ-like beta-propeller repeat protein [Bacteroidales bacterium]|nr:PQQ-like beta-propeller repeat protein [Bacteroidales bacterium]